jgi:hypothetical protein
MEKFTHVKLEIFIPQESVLTLRDELARIGVGVIGDYDHCFAATKATGYFRPLDGAKPFVGKIGEIKVVMEYKLEVNCKRDLVNDALKVVKRVHPYEEPLINIIPLANHLFID